MLAMNPILTLGISPCPNDTFIFEGWVTGKTQADIITHNIPKILFADVQSLNEAAQRAELDVVKVSCGALPLLLNEYQVLSCGGAMGFGCGPLLLSSGLQAFDPNVETWLPGKNTTATQLFKHWCRGLLPLGVEPKIRYAFFDELYRELCLGNAKQGVVIHEHRFTFERDGLTRLCDLGEHWESTTHSPIPLGVILGRKSLGEQTLQSIEATIQASLTWAWARESLITPFIAEHAQETSPEVMEAHIRMFVNEFSMKIGASGEKALKVLLQLADNH